MSALRPALPCLFAALLGAAPVAMAAEPPVVVSPAPAATAPNAATPAPSPASKTNPLAKEQLYADIVRRASGLKTRTNRFVAKPVPSLRQGQAFNRYSDDIRALAKLDMQAHYDLIRRGTDRDLKCILMGVSRDLPIKLDSIKAAKTDADLKNALQNMSDLLDDNAGLITAPATADSGADCTLEFGKDANALPAQ